MRLRPRRLVVVLAAIALVVVAAQARARSARHLADAPGALRARGHGRELLGRDREPPRPVVRDPRSPDREADRRRQSAAVLPGPPHPGGAPRARAPPPAPRGAHRPRRPRAEPHPGRLQEGRRGGGSSRLVGRGGGAEERPRRGTGAPRDADAGPEARRARADPGGPDPDPPGLGPLDRRPRAGEAVAPVPRDRGDDRELRVATGPRARRADGPRGAGDGAEDRPRLLLRHRRSAREEAHVRGAGADSRGSASRSSATSSPRRRTSSRTRGRWTCRSGSSQTRGG